MNCKYKGTGRLSAIGLLCLITVLTACEDDLGDKGQQSGHVTVNVKAPAAWTSATAVDEKSPESRCLSVDATETNSDIPLYLHTIHSDNAAAQPASRGKLENSVSNFSLSAVSYAGTYPENEDDVVWTPGFAHDITFTVNGETATCPEMMFWPTGGKVRFFAFAPVNAGRTDDPFTLSGATAQGSPRIGYEVPERVQDQHDLMAACTDAISADVKLEFRHILTAVKIVAAPDMVPGIITGVTLSGVYNKGTFIPRPGAANDAAANDTWIPDESSTGTYRIKRDIPVGGSTDSENQAGNAEKNFEVIGETDDLTLLMIPQTLPENAKLEIEFTKTSSGDKYTLWADLKGTWPEGKIVTYSLSPSSVHITPVVEFNKTTADILPYSGVWDNVEVRAYAAITEAGADAIRYKKLPTPEIEYTFEGKDPVARAHTFFDPDGCDIVPTAGEEGSDTYSSTEKIPFIKGMYVLGAQSDFENLQGNLNGDFDHDETDLADTESANCYMVDAPGNYKFPVVYGNTYKDGSLNLKACLKPVAATNAMTYYPDYAGKPIESFDITEACDAVLAWQDAPGLIDNVTFTKGSPSYISFRVRRYSITQGNALIVALDANSKIVWSWHIWVSQHKQEWKTGTACKEIGSIYKNAAGKYEKTGKKYSLADVNLGYCDPHKGNEERKFRIRFKVKVDNGFITLTKYLSAGTTVDTEASIFTQAEFRGSVAGDNTYYQLGRSAPTPGGIYSDKTTKYYYKGGDYSELNMENKPLFYNNGNDTYALCRNTPGKVSGASYESGSEEKGVTVQWAIQHPHVFVMSPLGDEYRNHWFKTENAVPDGRKLFRLWNPKATKFVNNMTEIEEDVAKSLYDPCPAGYMVPPANAFSAFVYSGDYYVNKLYNTTLADGSSYTTKFNSVINSVDRKWVMEVDGVTFEFPATGVRNKCLKKDHFSTVYDSGGAKSEGWEDWTYPAFRILTYITSSTFIYSGNNDAAIFYIDNRYKGDTGSDCLDKSNSNPVTGSHHPSASSYGLSVRPMREPDFTH